MSFEKGTRKPNSVIVIGEEVPLGPPVKSGCAFKMPVLDIVGRCHLWLLAPHLPEMEDSPDHEGDSGERKTQGQVDLPGAEVHVGVGLRLAFVVQFEDIGAHERLRGGVSMVVRS